MICPERKTTGGTESQDDHTLLGFEQYHVHTPTDMCTYKWIHPICDLADLPVTWLAPFVLPCCCHINNTSHFYIQKSNSPTGRHQYHINWLLAASLFATLGHSLQLFFQSKLAALKKFLDRNPLLQSKQPITSLNSLFPSCKWRQVYKVLYLHYNTCNHHQYPLHLCDTVLAWYPLPWKWPSH